MRSQPLQSMADAHADKSDPHWEHKRRAAEMAATADAAAALTAANKGRHFIGDFVPKEQLELLMRKAAAVRRGEKVEEEQYAGNKLDGSNKGYSMLKAAGWKEGDGAAPVAAGTGANAVAGAGVGVGATHEPAADDDEFELFRKRMMLGYRFRPNLDNAPRRSYY